ncbi:MAG: xanthine dehydrogenase family protein molybdopterin-binding subunit, partial [Clostridiales Family XIII bacterium]|nr:xanthine dehydrogenase family protein molybdopterin-binding subunit [Clostridiales Family XIII bacterium]
HILCKEVVRYVGDYVALVVATEEGIAAQAAALVRIEYEELPAVFDVETALEDGPIKVHEDVGSYLPTGFQELEDFGLDPSKPNMFASFVQQIGDVEQGFTEADLIVESRYNIPFVSHCTLETHQCVVIPETDGRLTVYASEQKGSTARYEMASDLGMIPGDINYRIPYLGGGFGGKTGISTVDVAAIGAMRYGLPVRIVMTREESFVSGGLRGAAVISVKDGYREDGSLVARHIVLLGNGGAYSTHSAILIMCAGEGAVGNYRSPNLLIESYGIYTHTPPTAPYRALGSEYMVYPIERNMDEAAKRLGIGRDEIRLKNVLVDGDTDGDGKKVSNNGSLEILERTIDEIRLDEKRPPEGPWFFGKSIALANKFVGAEDPNGTGAHCRIGDDGTATIYVSHVELGHGGLSVDAMAAAEVLKLPFDRMRVVFGDSEQCPHDMGTFCSRGTLVNGNAVLLAAEDAKKKMFDIASGVMKLPVDALDTEDGKIFEKANPENAIEYKDLFTGDGSLMEAGQIMGTATWHHPFAFDEYPNENPTIYSYGGWGVEVAVNSETGEVRLEKLAGCYDCGTVINPMTCEGQIEGAFSMGLGQALYEETLLNDAGKVINPNFRDYRIPTFMDGPRNAAMSFSFVDRPYEYGAYGAKGIGEVSAIPVIPAIANAVSDAIGAELSDLPFTRERVLAAIRETNP